MEQQIIDRLSKAHEAAQNKGSQGAFDVWNEVRAILDEQQKPGDTELSVIERATDQWDGTDLNIVGRAIRTEARRLHSIANATGAPTSSEQALADMRKLAKLTPFLTIEPNR